MRILSLILLLGIAGCASNPVARAHQTTVLLTMDNGTCSGTAVGPHVVLTAEHCLTGAHSLAINGSPADVRQVVLDHADHALVTVSATFEHFAVRGAAPTQGDKVFIIGNPGILRDMYRSGEVSGTQVFNGRSVTLYNENGYFGDSGSGIFNDAGELIGVISVLHQQTDQAYMKLMGSFTLQFTPQQWAQALK